MTPSAAIRDGSIDHRREYGPWGEVRDDETTLYVPARPFGFSGGVWDTDTSLVRFGARDCNQTAGRWTARVAEAKPRIETATHNAVWLRTH